MTPSDSSFSHSKMKGKNDSELKLVKKVSIGQHTQTFLIKIFFNLMFFSVQNISYDKVALLPTSGGGLRFCN